MNNVNLQPYDYVDPLINTAKPKSRWVFFQSASVPFGMVQLSPDTNTTGTWGTGYRYYSKKIRCFSHIHSWQLGAVAVLPFCEEGPRALKNGYRLNHNNEEVHPGYHRLFLSEAGIGVELTASERVGFHRYTYPEDSNRGIAIDLGRQLGPSKMAESKTNVISPGVLTGYVDNAPTTRRPKSCRVFFRMEFDTAVKRTEILESGVVFLDFGKGGQRIEMKVALSYVSEEGAAANLKNEAGGVDFDKARQKARKLWEDHLERIKVSGGTKKQRTRFYTDLWRTAFGGHVINDVDGRYCDNTGEKPVIRRISVDKAGEPEFRFLSNADIFWGCHWSLGLLWDLAYPDVKSDYCKSLVEMYKYGGLIPRGPSGGNYTFVMIAARSCAFLASAYMKGIRDFDIKRAYAGMKRNAFPGGLMGKSGYEHETALDGGIEYFIERGHVPERDRRSPGIHCDGAAQTLEYSYDHWCIAQMAKVLGKTGDYGYFMEKSRNYRNIYDPQTGFMRPRTEEGGFIEPFDPLELKGFCEGNSWGYTFYVPHDLEGLAGLMGGYGKMVEKLDDAFKKAGDMRYYAPKPKLERNRAYVNYGNENTRFTAFVFNHAGRPDLTQKWSRKVYEKLFSSISLRSFCEDDDCGLAAGTGVLLALGLFDIKGGAYENPVYEPGSPVFDKVSIKLCDRYYPGGEFKIEIKNNSSSTPYIKSIALNKKPIKSAIPHDDLIKGGLLEIEMTDSPPALT